MVSPQKLLEDFGLKPGGLPGTAIPFLLLIGAIAPFRGSLFSIIRTPGLPESLVVVLAAFGVMLNKVIADAILDRFYDHFYGEGFGRWESTTSNQWIFFPRGHDLKDVRGRTRQYFIDHDTKEDYGAKDSKGRFIETIYRPVIHDIEGTDPAVYRAVQAELSWSKTARNSILPLAAFSLSAAALSSVTLAGLLLGLAAVLAIPFFSLRYTHQVSLYHRFCSKHGA